MTLAKLIAVIICDTQSKVLFSHTCENNDYAVTIAEAKRLGVSLAGADFVGVTFPESVDFRGMDLTCARFDECVLNSAKFNKARLIGTKFIKTQLSGCDFSRCDLTESLFLEAEICGCQFGAARLLNSCFDTSKIFESSFIAASLCGTKFVRCALALTTIPPSLDGVMFTSGVLDLVTLRSATKIKGAKLSGVRIGLAVKNTTGFALTYSEIAHDVITLYNSPHIPDDPSVMVGAITRPLVKTKLSTCVGWTYPSLLLATLRPHYADAVLHALRWLTSRKI